MDIKQGYSYHIKDEYFELVQDKKLMSNKENGSYRPNFYAIEDVNNSNIFWLIPISSQVSKFTNILNNKLAKFGKCFTIVIHYFGGDERVFLIQNAFPITADYLDHIHTVQGIPITVHEELDKILQTNLRSALAFHRKGIRLIFPDIDRIYKMMIDILE